VLLQYSYDPTQAKWFAEDANGAEPEQLLLRVSARITAHEAATDLGVELLKEN